MKEREMHMNVVEQYQQRVYELYTQTHPNANPDKVRQLIGQLTEQKFRNIPCEMHNNVTRERFQTTMVDVFEWIKTRNPIITGNGTFFKQHEEYLSPKVKMLEKLQQDRKKKKDEMYSLPKGSSEYVNLNVAQLAIKVIMNADYGGSGTTMSPFYSAYLPPATTQSAKTMTTSLICCLEFISDNDNKWAKMNSINELFDMIYTVLNTPVGNREFIDDFYTVDEVLGRLVSKTNNLTSYDIKTLKLYLSSLNPKDLTKLMLAFNVKLVLTKYLPSHVESVMNYFKSHPVDIDNITEKSLHESGFGVNPPEEIADDISYINKIVEDNCVYPFILNDNEMRANNMTRVIVCVTDTDSLMIHLSSYLDEFQARTNNFKNSCLFASALGMRLFVETIIPQMVSDIATFCNINDKYYRDKFVFKNEFTFLAMTLFAKKMYASSLMVQEGKPRDPHDIAITGLSFKKRDSAEFLEPIMLELYDKKILTAENVDVEGIYNEYISLRDKLMREIDSDPSYYKVLSVKDVSAYDPNKVLPTQMRGSIVWNNIMPDEEILPMDRVIVIPLSFKLMDENRHIGQVNEILRLSLIDNENRKTDPVICLPEHYKEIPEWIKPIIDKEYAIDKLLAPFKQILGLFDFYTADTRAGFIASRMLYL